MEPLDNITSKIIQAIFAVYNELGPGLLESTYEEAMEYELGELGCTVKRQEPTPLIYKGHVLKTDLRLDMLVDDRVIVELKSVDELKKVHFKQLRTYLKLTGKEAGLLVNFNEENVRDGIHRINLKKYR